MEQLDFIINGGETVRFHTWPVLRPQRVDSHSYHVAMLCALMAQDEPVERGHGLTVPLLMAALTHDLAEWKVGDMPSPSKRAMPDYGDITFREVWSGMEQDLLAGVGLDWEALLTPKDLRWLKLADNMQGALYCIRERAMGNQLIAEPYSNFRKYIAELMQVNGENNMEQNIVQYIDDMWEQHNGA
jgi:5'-deoxynucleotidase YfbR-like HD superfamily hydrolase